MDHDEELLTNRRILTAQEVSEKLRISLSTVHHLTRLGKIKAIKIGKQWRYVEEEVDHCLSGGYDLRKDDLERRKSDRRLHHRINCFIQGSARIPHLLSQPWEGNGAALNLSEGGLLFEVAELQLGDSRDIQQDEQITVTLFFPASFRPQVEIDGRIIHLETEDKVRFGIKFSSLSEQIQRMIRDYIG